MNNLFDNERYKYISDGVYTVGHRLIDIKCRTITTN